MDFIKIKECGIVPVIKIEDAKKAVPLARALLLGGINVMEITFRTAAAAEAIANVAREVPEMFIGAGTVITKEQLFSAKKAGAKFLVSPGLNLTIVKTAIAENVPILPGVITPSEICTGLELGLEVFKFFPSENYGGINTVKALSAPFGNVSFVPTGGINENNVLDYFRFDKVLAIGGSWMATETFINANDYEQITIKTKEAVSLMKTVRG